MITRNRILFVLGVWVLLIPFLGFPSPYKSFFMIVSGLAIIVLAFLYARDKRMVESTDTAATKREVVTEVYSESYPIFTKPEMTTEERYTNLEEIRRQSAGTRTQ